jgi:hypothetical protein
MELFHYQLDIESTTTIILVGVAATEIDSRTEVDSPKFIPKNLF